MILFVNQVIDTLGQIERFSDKIRMFLQETVDDIMILRFSERAGRVDQNPILRKVLCTHTQYTVLQLWQDVNICVCFVTNFGFSTKDPPSRTRHIAQNAVTFGQRFFFRRVTQCGTDDQCTELFCRIIDQFQFMLMDIIGKDLSPVFHTDGGIKGFSSRSGTNVGDSFTGLSAEYFRAKLARSVLDKEMSLRKLRYTIKAAGMTELQRIF